MFEDAKILVLEKPNAIRDIVISTDIGNVKEILKKEGQDIGDVTDVLIYYSENATILTPGKSITKPNYYTILKEFNKKPPHNIYNKIVNKAGEINSAKDELIGIMYLYYHKCNPTVTLITQRSDYKYVTEAGSVRSLIKIKKIL